MFFVHQGQKNLNNQVIHRLIHTIHIIDTVICLKKREGKTNICFGKNREKGVFYGTDEFSA